MSRKPLGIYIHIPFCVRKCPYCGFYSLASGEDEASVQSRLKYAEKLASDIASAGEKYGHDRIVDTVYIGGGTPSVMEPALISKILDAVRTSFTVSGDAEVSMEVNPGTVNSGKLRVYRRAGVNRLSIGCQSLDDGILKNLGRIHTADDFRKTFKEAREAGFDNISCDLMFAVPGHSMEIWKKTVTELTEMGPEHISFYSLQIEEGTPYYSSYKNGELMEIPDGTDRAMYHEALELMKRAGYHQYEISSCARKGYECRHNIKYWTLADYIGIGDSASSYIDGKRITNEPFYEYHENTKEDDMSEYVFTGLRMNRGVSYRNFRERFGLNMWDAFAEAGEEIAAFVSEGYAVDDGESLRLTAKGFDISNKIMALFV